MNTVRRLSYVFLCIVPFLCFVVVGVRAFRLPGVYQAVGFTYFAAIAMAAWTLSAGAIRAAVQGRRLLGLAGTLLITPFALVALLWVGLGGPWQANPGREPDAVSCPHCYGDRDSEWIRGAQRSTQPRR